MRMSETVMIIEGRHLSHGLFVLKKGFIYSFISNVTDSFSFLLYLMIPEGCENLAKINLLKDLISKF